MPPEATPGPVRVRNFFQEPGQEGIVRWGWRRLERWRWVRRPEGQGRVPEPGPDALLEFRRGRLGEGDHQELAGAGDEVVFEPFAVEDGDDPVGIRFI